MSNAEGEKRPKVTINFPGVEEPLPKYWSNGEEVIYYCPHCQQPPANDDQNKVVVSVNHDLCLDRAAGPILRGIEESLQRFQTEIDVLRNQNVNLALGLGLDPDSVFGDDSE